MKNKIEKELKRLRARWEKEPARRDVIELQARALKLALKAKQSEKVTETNFDEIFK